MKFFKRCLLVVLVLFIILISGVFILTTFYKKEIADALIQNLKTNYNLSLKVEEVNVSVFDNFPQGSVKLKNVVIDHELYRAELPLLKAGEVRISFDLHRLLQKQFEIKSVFIDDALVNMVTTKEGNKNFRFGEKDTVASAPSSGGIAFDMHKITISNTKFIFQNMEKQQLIDVSFDKNVIKLKKIAEGFDFSFTGKLNIGGLLFNHKKGAFLKNSTADTDLSGTFFTRTKSCFIREPSSLDIGEQKYYVNVFLQLGEIKQLALRLYAGNVSYKQASRLVNQKMNKALSNFTVNKPFNINLLLVTKLGIKQDPIVSVHIASEHNDVTIGNTKVHYEDVSFKGQVLSLDTSLQKGNEEEAIIRFSEIKGNIYKVPFKASVTLRNFTDPFINIRASLFIDAEKAEIKAAKEFELKGKCIANLDYSGSTKKLNKKEFLGDDMKLKADLTMTNFTYKERDKSHVFTVNGKAKLYNRHLEFDRLNLSTAGGNVLLTGEVDYFVKYALGLTNDLRIKLNVYTDKFDLNPFMKKKPAVATATVATTGNTVTAEAPATNKKAVKKTVNQSNFDFAVFINAKKLIIRKVIAEKTSMNLSYQNNVLNIKSFKTTTCNGTLSANILIDNLQKVKADIDVEQLDVNALFEQFENFGQQAIKSDQLKGKISVHAKFDTDLDQNMEIVPSSMDGKVSLKLKDGHLLEYEPLQNVSNFIFHNRDFNDVTFSELNETFTIKGYEMNIEELEIASNILNLFVSGTYNFKSQSNINLVIPWSNLKRRGKNYIPKSSGMAAEDAKGLKLNFSGEPKKMKLSLGHK